MIHTVASIVVALLFLVTGGGKVLGLAQFRRNREKLGVGPGFWRLTGALELAGAIGLIAGLWFWPLGVAAASGLTLLMIGAIIARNRANQPGIAADIAVGILTIVTVVTIVFQV